MTLSFRLLLDMHKCQSDYNGGSASPRPPPRLPATCLSFCHMPQCIQGPKKGQRAVSCKLWVWQRPFSRSLVAYTPIEHDKTQFNCWQITKELPLALGAGARPSSCCTQVRLLPLGCTSFEGEPKISTADQSQVPRATFPPPSPSPPSASSCLAVGLNLATNEKQRFNNFGPRNPFWALLMPSNFRSHLRDKCCQYPPLTPPLSYRWFGQVLWRLWRWAESVIRFACHARLSWSWALHCRPTKLAASFHLAL